MSKILQSSVKSEIAKTNLKNCLKFYAQNAFEFVLNFANQHFQKTFNLSEQKFKQRKQICHAIANVQTDCVYNQIAITYKKAKSDVEK